MPVKTLGEKFRLCEDAIGRSLTSFESLLLNRPYRFSFDTQTWSRVLKPVLDGPTFGFIEIPLSLLIERTKQKATFHASVSPETPFHFFRTEPLLIRLRSFPIEDQFFGSVDIRFHRRLQKIIGYNYSRLVLYSDVLDSVSQDKFSRALENQRHLFPNAPEVLLDFSDVRLDVEEPLVPVEEPKEEHGKQV